jgi:hypothetical protein
MPEEEAVGCARPTGGLVGEEAQPAESSAQDATQKSKNHKESMSMIKVGKKAPDFQAPAYHNGEFTSVKLSDHLGKWVLLCFYPGDFTFV